MKNKIFNTTYKLIFIKIKQFVEIVATFSWKIVRSQLWLMFEDALSKHYLENGHTFNFEAFKEPSYFLVKKLSEYATETR